MTLTVQRVATFGELYEAILALPEGITGEILEDGRIETMGRPGRGHTRAGYRLGRLLGSLEDEDERDGWVFAPEREIRLLGTRLAVPDLSGFRIVEGDDAFLDHNPIERRPEWACEILSPSTERRDRVDKLPLYARAGVAHTWLIDVEARFVEVYETRAGVPAQVRVAREADVVRLPPFLDLEIDLSRLWAPRRGR